MQASNNKKIPLIRGLELSSAKRIKRIFHIKSQPAQICESNRKASASKLSISSKGQQQIKPKRIKTQQQLKVLNYGVMKPPKMRKLQFANQQKKLIDHHYQSSKSFTKSTNCKSPRSQKKPNRKLSKDQNFKSKKTEENPFSGIIRRAKEVMEEYQLKMNRCLTQKSEAVAENQRLKSQLQALNKKMKKIQK